MSSVALLKDRSLGRIIAGHPWVFESDILRIVTPPPDGDEIGVLTAKGGFIGVGFYNSKSKIPIRIFSRSSEKWDESFLRRRLLEAKSLREKGPQNPTFSLPSSAYRLFWSEADFLPGLVADRYGDALAIQTLTLALDQRKDLILKLLKEIHHPSLIVERNDVSSRTFEGLPQQKGIVFGEGETLRVLDVNGMKLEVDLLEGQKTGAYLDQILNQQMVGNLASGLRVLDCFAYQGGFALRAALGGAREVEGWDVSEGAIKACQRNASLNGITHAIWKAVNAFDEFKAMEKTHRRFDLIILDPPSFTRSREKLQDALRGYKEIHLRALKLLDRGGLLATFCCSHHVDTDTFRSVVLDAAFDARKLLRLQRTFSQAPDHPMIPAIPETEYLKGFLFQVV